MPNRILLVDDHDALTHGISLVLQAEDYHVDTVHSGEAALCALESNRYDVVLLDYSMPGMTGIEVLERMQNKSGSTTPTIMISANEHIDAACLMLGARSLLTKPFSVAALLRAVREVCLSAQTPAM